jgi:hypothetical protein
MKTKTRTPNDSHERTRKPISRKPATSSQSKIATKSTDWIDKVSGILDGPGNFNIERGKTPYERTKHLLEVLTDLPSDISTNPKYMEDFGR